MGFQEVAVGEKSFSIISRKTWECVNFSVDLRRLVIERKCGGFSADSLD